MQRAGKYQLPVSGRLQNGGKKYIDIIPQYQLALEVSRANCKPSASPSCPETSLSEVNHGDGGKL